MPFKSLAATLLAITTEGINMGIWDKLFGEFVDVIEWTDSSVDTMVYRFQRYGNEIKFGAKANGSRIANCGICQRSTGITVLKVRLKLKSISSIPSKFVDLKWGTKNPIMMRDKEFNMVRLRTFGTYNIRIEDPAKFINEIILVENISLPPAVEEALDKRTSMGMIGNLDKYIQFGAAESMQNGSASGGAGSAIEMGLGFAMANKMANEMNPTGLFHSRNGKRVQRVRTVPRIRWRPVGGQVDLHFDDVLIGASKTLPRTIINHLQPWDLDNLVPYSEEYISGFRSEIYQVTVDQGFLQAENIMEHKINQSIRHDIGGDHQRISATYRYVINGRNGTIQGERPYSFIKIGLAVITVIAAALALLYVMESNGVFENMNQGGSFHMSPIEFRF
ncbi:hypothetical protein GQR58_006699 [Nymphon striatum]|nr:hypothetical protein GQR58_006699 [Nymphon striatum]